jgi:Ca2+/Na+ antiporter
MLGFILIAVLTWQTYKAANEGGRNGVLWAVGAFIGSFVLQIAIVIVLAIIFLAANGGRDDSLSTSFTWIASIIAMVVNLAAFWLLIKYLSRVPETGSFTAPPPPPTNF